MLVNLDCMEFMKTMKDKSVDLILTDIPYGEVNRKDNGLRNLNKGDADIFNLDLEELVKNLCKKCKGSIYIFCGTEQVSMIRKLLVENGMSTRLCIWEKTNPSPMNGKSIWLSGIECCVFGKFSKATFNEHCKNTVWRFPTTKSKIHPTQKPLKLFEYLITVSSNENDVVFDPFSGSGTTAVACKKLNRKFIGCELNKDFYDKSLERLSLIN